MTVTSTTAESGPYVTDGYAASFGITFEYEAASEVRVFLIASGGTSDDEVEITTGWSVQVSGTTHNVTFVTAPAAGTLWVRRDTPVFQEIEFGEGTNLTATNVEAGFDALTRVAQDQARDIARLQDNSVSLDGAQTLTNKTLASPALTGSPRANALTNTARNQLLADLGVEPGADVTDTTNVQTAVLAAPVGAPTGLSWEITGLVSGALSRVTASLLQKLLHYAGFSRAFTSRADAAAWAAGADGQAAPGGTVIRWEGIAWSRDASVTAIADMPGWRPVGDVYETHFGAGITAGVDETDRLQAALDYVASLSFSSRSVGYGGTLHLGRRPLLRRRPLQVSQFASIRGDDREQSSLYGDAESCGPVLVCLADVSRSDAPVTKISNLFIDGDNHGVEQRTVAVLAGVSSYDVGDVTGIEVGYLVEANGIPWGATVTAISGTTVTVSAAGLHDYVPRTMFFREAYTTSATMVVNSADVMVSSTTGLRPGLYVTGTGIRYGSYILSVSGAVVTLSLEVASSGVRSLVFHRYDTGIYIPPGNGEWTPAPVLREVEITQMTGDAVHLQGDRGTLKIDWCRFRYNRGRGLSNNSGSDMLVTNSGIGSNTRTNVQCNTAATPRLVNTEVWHTYLNEHFWDLRFYQCLHPEFSNTDCNGRIRIDGNPSTSDPSGSMLSGVNMIYSPKNGTDRVDGVQHAAYVSLSNTQCVANLKFKRAPGNIKPRYLFEMLGQSRAFLTTPFDPDSVSTRQVAASLRDITFGFPASGTWTPVITDASGNSWDSGQPGTWTVIGDTITVTHSGIYFIDTTGLVPTDPLRIGGFPLAIATLADLASGGVVWARRVDLSDMATGEYRPIFTTMYPGNKFCTLKVVNQDNYDRDLLVSELVDDEAGVLRFSISYPKLVDGEQIAILPTPAASIAEDSGGVGTVFNLTISTTGDFTSLTGVLTLDGAAVSGVVWSGTDASASRTATYTATTLGELRLTATAVGIEGPATAEDLAIVV